MKKKNIIVIVLLIFVNIFLLWLSLRLKTEVSVLTENYKSIFKKNERQLFLENLIFKNNIVAKNKLNLIVVWSINGCGSCKQRLADKFAWYKNNFGDSFKFLFIEESSRELKFYRIEEYLAFQYDSVSDLFLSRVEIKQPFLLLTDENGKIILSHELIVGDTKEFERFNLKVHALFNIL